MHRERGLLVLRLKESLEFAARMVSKCTCPVSTEQGPSEEGLLEGHDQKAGTVSKTVSSLVESSKPLGADSWRSSSLSTLDLGG